MSTTILAIGLMVFFSHFLSALFNRTNIPDVLVLMIVGIVIGPVLGITTPDDFGKIGSLIATIALVLILFEGGTSLNLKMLGSTMGTTGILSFGCFLLTDATITLIGFYALDLSLLPALLLGTTLGGTTSAVVIPVVKSLKLSDRSTTVMVLESAITDVLCIVGVFALLQVHTHGDIEAGRMVGSVMASLVFAALFGLLGGIGWLSVLGRVRDFPNTISSTLAFAFIVYGITEMLGFSGAIASLALGVTLTNFEKFRLHRLPSIDLETEPLSEIDLIFYREVVFLLKTYFFVYLGISIHFSKIYLAVIAVCMVLVAYALRLVLTRVLFRGNEYTLRDASFTSMMAPKGLAAAVLASLPLQYGVEGGDVIRDTTYLVVLVSISLTALLVMTYPRSAMQKLYSRALGKPIELTEVSRPADSPE